MKSSKKYSILLLPFYLIMCLMKSSKNFEKVPILKIWQLISFWSVKTHFGETSLKRYIFRNIFLIFTNSTPLIVIALTKSSLCCILMIFLLFFGFIRYPKDNFCLHESIFQWEIKHISHQSEFWHLRRKAAVIFWIWTFFQNSLVISYCIKLGKMQVEEWIIFELFISGKFDNTFVWFILNKSLHMH